MEIKPNRVCLWCGGELPKRRRKYCCDEHAKLYFEEKIAPLWWANARFNALRRAGYQCEYIDKDGNRCPETQRLETHHIAKLEDANMRHNSPLNKLENLIILCRPHHEDAHRIHPKDGSVVIPKEQLVLPPIDRQV